MTGTLTDIVADMMTREGADRVLLDDGADTWCLDALYDMLERDGDDGKEYYEEDGIIYAVKGCGCLCSRCYWPVDLTEPYTRQRLLDSGYDLPDID